MAANIAGEPGAVNRSAAAREGAMVGSVAGGPKPKVKNDKRRDHGRWGSERVREGREDCRDSSGGGRGEVPLKIGVKNTHSRRRRHMRRWLEENSCGEGKGGVPLK